MKPTVRMYISDFDTNICLTPLYVNNLERVFELGANDKWVIILNISKSVNFNNSLKSNYQLHDSRHLSQIYPLAFAVH